VKVGLEPQGLARLEHLLDVAHDLIGPLIWLGAE
jgi:hypothetical protein